MSFSWLVSGSSTTATSPGALSAAIAGATAPVRAIPPRASTTNPRTRDFFIIVTFLVFFGSTGQVGQRLSDRGQRRGRQVGDRAEQGAAVHARRDPDRRVRAGRATAHAKRGRTHRTG